MTKAEKKYIKQLQQKKYRNRYGTFVVEGWKSIIAYLEHQFEPVSIYSIDTAIPSINIDIDIISRQDLQSASLLQHPKDALAVFSIKEHQKLPETGLVIALDNLQDPGNLGTIIRTADWFGISDIVCSSGTVDCYNPKVVQATMGSLARVKVHYTDLAVFLQQTDLPVYGTFMQGDNLYQTALPKQAVVVIGNEGNGISKEIAALTQHKIHIPKHKDALAESLNAAIATSLVINAFIKQ